MPKSWRERAAPIIARVLAETAGQDEKAIRQALRDAYPFGSRENYPYAVWCDEIRRQRHLPRSLTAKHQKERRAMRLGQLSLFEEVQS